jgi:hypothetical protein
LSARMEPGTGNRGLGKERGSGAESGRNDGSHRGQIVASAGVSPFW